MNLGLGSPPHASELSAVVAGFCFFYDGDFRCNHGETQSRGPLTRKEPSSERPIGHHSRLSRIEFRIIFYSPEFPDPVSL